jgi:hypothetical protein
MCKRGRNSNIAHPPFPLRSPVALRTQFRNTRKATEMPAEKLIAAARLPTAGCADTVRIQTNRNPE